MKLSQAIRKGSKVIRKHYRGALFQWNKEDDYGNVEAKAACVLGTAYAGLFGKVKVSNLNTYDYYNSLRKEFPELNQVFENSKDCLELNLIKLNDTKKLPRYQIVRWLERRGL